MKLHPLSLLVPVLVAFVGLGAREEPATAYSMATTAAEQALASGDLPKALAHIDRALERDAGAPKAWGLRARWAEASGDRSELVWSLHRELRASVASRAPKADIEALRAKLESVDPIAAELFAFKGKFRTRLEAVAAQYEKDKRPHAGIRVHKEILAIDPEHQPSIDAIQRLASTPDPSLASDAKPRDLFEGVSKEWIAEHDAKHREWKDHATIKRANYVTRTNAGYETLIRASEAMEQMNAFYRQFFNFGVDGSGVGPIELRIFATRDEYLKLGEGPPVKWSGGHFTGGAVETFVDNGGFESMTGTLFHEAAHQFVSLATNASGWLNEGLASFFEGCRVLANGTVQMNLPADHRLFPLAQRMEVGFMTSADDGIDPADPEVEPKTAPTFAIVLENKYEWGPAWYAPTWGVVYFLYNYRDPFDGRYVYRKAFGQFINSSGGRMGEGAIQNFEEVVLAQPMPPYKVDGKPPKRSAEFADVSLPKTVEELNVVWKDWILTLRDQQLGLATPRGDWLRWATLAHENGDLDVAQEHFEKGLSATPNDPVLLLGFAEFLEKRKALDRATKLGLEAARALESVPKLDSKLLARAEGLVSRCDPARSSLDKIHAEVWKLARDLVERYEQAGMELQVMEVAMHFSTELGVPDLLAAYERALRKTGRSIQLWELAYNESDLAGWNGVGQTGFSPSGNLLEAKLGEYASDSYDYQVLTMDKITSGDYSFEAQVSVEPGKGVFAGLVFGRKDAATFHSLIVFPGRKKGAEASAAAAKTAGGGFADLASFFGGTTKTWRHNPLDETQSEGQSQAERWYKLRIEVSGSMVDCWVDSALMASQDFGNSSVLRGSFGLITGKGSSRFREVRYKARSAKDSAGAIERDLVMQKLKASGQAVNGSYVGLQPPFPRVGDWAQGARASWDEKRGTPQLLVLWSIEQNEIVRISDWLQEFAKEGAQSGLEIVSICSPNDSEQIEAYLASNPIPGTVGVDARENVGIGETNKAFFTGRFHLPRLVLLDVDGTVAWEGDPGISASEPWAPGQETYLTVPFRELVAKRRILEFQQWAPSWKERAVPALARGDLSLAWPVLLAGAALDPIYPEVALAQARLEALRTAIADPASSAERLVSQGRGAAFEVLVEWAAVTGEPIEKATLTGLKSLRTDSGIKDWDLARKTMQSHRVRIVKDPAFLQEALGKLANLKGPFVDELRSDMSALLGQDKDSILKAVDAVQDRPKLWLAQSFFRW